MGCMVLCRAFHTAPKQGQGPTPIVRHCSSSDPGPCPGTGHSPCDYTITGKYPQAVLCIVNLKKTVCDLIFLQNVFPTSTSTPAPVSCAVLF